jgi:hypothetical protein
MAMRLIVMFASLGELGVGVTFFGGADHTAQVRPQTVARGERRMPYATAAAPQERRKRLEKSQV